MWKVVTTSLRRIAALLPSVLFAFATTACAPRTENLEPIRETVVYSTIQPANWDLYLFDRAGSAPRRLTTDSGLDYNPAISPDGRWVVFTSERNGNPDLYVLDLQRPDTPPIQLTRTQAMEDAAAFSPDGRSLAFVGTPSGNADIFVMGFSPEEPGKAGQPANLTRHESGDYNPAF